MKPPAFDYIAPASLSEVVSRLASCSGEAKILAGGQSLMPLLNMRMARPDLLIDLRHLTELDYIRPQDHGIAIGALTTKRSVEDSDLVKRQQPMFHAATRLIGHLQIRNRGTVGGSLAHADPAAEYPAVALALDGELQAIGPNGRRTVAAADFYITYLTTALEPDEVLCELYLPAFAETTGWSFREVTRRHGDFALAGAAITLRIESNRCRDTHIVVFGTGPTAIRVPQAEAVVDGASPTEAIFEQAGHTVAEVIDEPISDFHAPSEYRRDLAQVLTRRGLAEAFSRATDG